MSIAGDPSCGGLFGMAFARLSYAPTGRRDRWFIERNPMVLCPNGAQGDSPGQSEALVVPTIADRCIEEAFEASCGGVDPQFGEDFARDVSKHRQISTARRA